MTIGEKIRKYRLARNLSQKQVALWAGMSEPAIRNYELGNRTPHGKQIEKIAIALEVSPYAISNPDLGTPAGIMHALFHLEENYGLVPDKIDGQFCFRFQNDISDVLNNNVELWYREYQNLKEVTKNNKEEAQEHYGKWKGTFSKVRV